MNKMLIVSSSQTAAILATHLPQGSHAINETTPRGALLRITNDPGIRKICIVSNDEKPCGFQEMIMTLARRQGRSLMFLSPLTDSLEGFQRFAGASA